MPTNNQRWKSRKPDIGNSQQSGGPGHLVELDSLRGVAATIVVFDHFRRFWLEANHPVWIESVRHNPVLLFLTAGQSSVVLFFLLSGFVLTLPGLDGRAESYTVYVARRVCRIYLPYLAALAIALAGCWRFHGLKLYSEEFQSIWAQAPDARTVAGHLLLLGKFKVFRYDPPVWSLVHEMRISLVFPALSWIARRAPAGWALLLAASFPLASLAIFGVHGSFFSGGDPGVEFVSFGRTLSYCGTFLLGSVLACHLEAWRAGLERMHGAMRWALGGAGLLLYVYGLRAGIPDTQFLTAIGGACLMMMALLEGGAISRVLHWRMLRFLGRVSYSLYLLHLPLLMVFSIAFHGRFAYVYLLPIFFASSIAAAAIFYRLVEGPSIRLGRQVSRWAGRAASVRAEIH